MLRDKLAALRMTDSSFSLSAHSPASADDWHLIHTLNLSILANLTTEPHQIPVGGCECGNELALQVLTLSQGPDHLSSVFYHLCQDQLDLVDILPVSSPVKVWLVTSGNRDCSGSEPERCL